MLTAEMLDLDGMRRNILRQGTPDKVYFFEHGESDEFKDEIVRRFDLDADLDWNAPEYSWNREINIQRLLGREIFRVWLPGSEFKVAGSKGTAWAEEHSGPIQTWADVESYDWPDAADIDYSQLDWYERHLPPDMAVFHTTKIWEVVRELFGFEGFCLKMYEEPELVEEVLRRIGEFHMSLTRALCNYRCVFAVYGADDYGYKTSTMMAPAIIENLFLSWHEAMSLEAHRHSKMYFMHVCGKIDSLMDVMIDNVRIDAKHSFEDTIEPITVAKEKWGHRVALLGGLDVDFLARSDEESVRERVRKTLDVCLPGGGYCLGLGNWVTNYIPVDNYLALLDEARRYTL